MTTTTIIYTQRGCRMSAEAKRLLTNNGIEYKEINVGDSSKNRAAMLVAIPGAKLTPQVILNGTHVGGLAALKSNPAINIHAKLAVKK